MMNTDRTFWQIGAGDNDRNHADICLRWGVILNGPGEYGPWPECEEKLRKDGYSARKVSDIRKFCDSDASVRDGDVVVLRVGTSSVYGVGIVRGGYEWFDDFGDVDGWDIQHVRRVQWVWKYSDSPQPFKTYALKRGDTTQTLNEGEVKNWINEKISLDVRRKSLPKLPPSCIDGEWLDKISREEIGEHLFDSGSVRARLAV